MVFCELADIGKKLFDLAQVCQLIGSMSYWIRR